MTARNILMSAAGAAGQATYVEDVFSTYLYTGNGSTQTITNGIDLAGKGGLVWAKKRTSATDENHVLFDTARGQPWLSSNTTNAQLGSSGLINYNADGFGWLFGSASWNSSGVPYASWTFRKQPKFFDVVTYTGNGTSQVINHNLGAVPGFIIVKRTDVAANWAVSATSSTGNYSQMYLNTTAAALGSVAQSTYATATTINVGLMASSGFFTRTETNTSGGTYVMYLFASNAGGFGLTGTDNVISCGITDAFGNATIGFEPQWILCRDPSNVDNWKIIDTMRGWRNGSTDNYLFANTSGAEGTNGGLGHPTATGFTLDGGTQIYIAIRRGPMKVPTDGAKVFSPITSSGSTGTVLTTNFPVDMLFTKARAGTASNPIVDRLRGVSTNSTEQGTVVYTNSTGAESGTTGESLAWSNTGFQIPSNWGGISNAFEAFLRAPSFFDEVCYTGTGSATTFNHNLGVAPEMMWVKRRNTTGTWRVYASGLTSAAYALTLNSTAAESSLPTVWNSTAPTSSVFSVGTSTDSNASGSTYVAYLFASCPGVSKVGSYTGNGSTQTIDCGFTGGARFVLIKRTDTTGDWYVWDTARGMVSGTDPSMLLNSTAAEVNANSVYTTTGGFQIVTAAAGINASGGTYIYLAIA